jgi:hypothetical protein
MFMAERFVAVPSGGRQRVFAREWQANKTTRFKKDTRCPELSTPRYCKGFPDPDQRFFVLEHFDEQHDPANEDFDKSGDGQYESDSSEIFLTRIGKPRQMR